MNKLQKLNQLLHETGADEIQKLERLLYQACSRLGLAYPIEWPAELAVWWRDNGERLHVDRLKQVAAESPEAS